MSTARISTRSRPSVCFLLLSPPSAFTDQQNQIAAKCIDRYCSLRVAQSEAKDESQVVIDTRLEAIVERMFLRCYKDGEFKQAIGIALEARRLDVLEDALKKSGALAEMLTYTFDVANNLVLSHKFRGLVIFECTIFPFIKKKKIIIRRCCASS